MKKVILILALLLTSLFVLASCNNDSSGGGDADAPVETITLTKAYWGGGDELRAWEDLMNLYMELNPHIVIEGTYTTGGEYPTRLNTFFASGTAPDVMGIANDIMRPFADQGVFYDLRPRMEAEGLLGGDIWLDVATEIFYYDGKILAMPFVYKIPAIVYNKDMFREAGLAYPTNDWTEAEMIEMAQILTVGEGRDKIYGFYLDWWPAIMNRNLYGNPVYLVEENRMNAVGNAEFRATIMFFESLINFYGVSIDSSMAVTEEGGFETGRYAMSLTAPWAMTALDSLIGDRFEWDIVMLPINETWGRWRGNVFADAQTISVDSENKDAAWDYIKWLCTTVEAQRLATFGVPMLQSFATSDDYLQGWVTNTQYDKSVFVYMLNYATGWETFGIWAQVNDEINTLYEEFIHGLIDIDTLINEVQSRGEAILAARE